MRMTGKNITAKWENQLKTSFETWAEIDNEASVENQTKRDCDLSKHSYI